MATATSPGYSKHWVNLIFLGGLEMAKKKKQALDANLIAQNRKARHDYAVTETYEAGLVLTGTEIKSVRARRVQLKDGYAQFHDGELWLMNVHINEYDNGNVFNHDPLRNRKLLLHKKDHLSYHQHCYIVLQVYYSSTYILFREVRLQLQHMDLHLTLMSKLQKHILVLPM